MKSVANAILILSLAGACSSATKPVNTNRSIASLNKKLSIKVMSHNILCRTCGASLATSRAKVLKGWDLRRQIIFSEILKQDPDIIGLQEVQLLQLEDFKTEFSRDYVLFHELNKNSSLGNMIMYKKNRFTELDRSRTNLPNINSESFNRSFQRVSLIDKNNPNSAPFGFINTHFDHKSKSSRLASTDILLDEVKRRKIQTILVGDFNAPPDSETVRAILNGGFFDLNCEDNQEHCESPTLLNSSSKIDYIFSTKEISEIEESQVRCNQSKDFPGTRFIALPGNGITVPVKSLDTTYSSDHFCLLINIILP